MLSKLYFILLRSIVSVEMVPSWAAAGHSQGRVNIWKMLIHVVRAKLLLIAIVFC